MDTRIHTLTLTSLLVTSPLFGQSSTDTTKTFTMDPVIVTATQIEALRSRIPNSVSLITKADIVSSGETSVLPLIGQRVPGVFVTERGVLGYGVSNGAAGTIMIRGTGGSPNTEVLVLTDGRPQMMGLMGHPLVDTYVSSGVQRVEVIRGPASLLYGTNAMGGVINIIYDKPSTSGESAEAGLSYGSYNTQKYELGDAYGFDGGGVSFFANHYQTDGQRAYSSFNSSNGSLRGNYTLSENLAMNADVSLTSFRTYDPGPSSAPLVNDWVDITRGSSGVSIENNNGVMQGALKAFFNWGRHDIYDGFHSTDNNLGLIFYQGLKLASGNATTVGVDYEHYGGVAVDQSSNFEYGRHFVAEISAYALVQQTVLEPVNLTAGIRLNHHNLYGWQSVPQIGLTYQVEHSTTLKVSASEGFRSPTIRELYLFPAPTPTLEPERMWNYEVGVLHNHGDRATFELTAFVSEGDNLIRVGGAFPNLTLSNSGRFVHRGIEFSSKIIPVADAHIDLVYSFLEPGDQTNANPRHKVYVGGAYQLGLLTFSAGAQYVAKLYGDDFGREPLPDYSLVNARVTAAIVGGFSLYAAGENLLDRQYQILYGYPMPGITLFVGANWNLH